MVVECFAIIIIVLAIAFIYLRAHKHAYAIAILPLTSVPLLHIIGYPLSAQLEKVLPLSSIQIHVAFDILAALIGCLAFGIFSSRFHQRRNRTVYLFTCGGFTIILTWVLVLQLIQL